MRSRSIAMFAVAVLLSATAACTYSDDTSSPGRNNPTNNTDLDAGNNTTDTARPDTARLDSDNNNVTYDVGSPDAADTSPVDVDIDVNLDSGGVDVGADAIDIGPDVPVDPPGGDCMTDAQCGPGTYCVAADPANGVAGYCTIVDCQSDADCDFGRTETFCCSDYAGYRGCWREGEGAVCGDGTGAQGADCSEGGQSDCLGANHYCLDLYGLGEAFCAQICTASASPGAPDSCPDTTWCYEYQPGYGICIPDGDSESHESCGDDPYGCGAGLLCLGTTETSTDLGYCAALCSGDEDCEPSQWCNAYPGEATGVCADRGSLPAGSSCVEDRFGCEEGTFCLYEGTRFARCSTYCSRDVDCAAGSACVLYSERPRRGVCVAYGDAETGEPCGANPLGCDIEAYCVGGYEAGYNPEAYCASVCDDGIHSCPDTFYCVDFGADVGSYCQPDGPAAVGEPCSGPLDCAQDTYCIGDGDSRICAGLCSADADCPADMWCTGSPNEAGVCYPAGDLGQGESCVDAWDQCSDGTYCAGPDPVCLGTCTDDPGSCPDGLVCLEDNELGQRWCYPAGDTPNGSACTEDYECEPGTYCSTWGTDAGRCLGDCDTDADCLDGYWCFATESWSQCLPKSAGGTTGESCADDPFSCAEDHLCAFASTPGAFCAEDCTGFANVCGDGEICRFMGYGINLCFPVGEKGHGESCTESITECNAETMCVSHGFTNAICVDLCSFEPDSCPAGSVCQFGPSGVGLCLPPGYDPGDPIGGGGPI